MITKTTPRDVYAELCASFLNTTPDVNAINRSIQSRFEIGEADASRVIRQVVAELNRRMFHPVTKMELILVEGCNLACTYCFESEFLNGQSRRRKLMEHDVIHKALDLLFSYSRDQKKLGVTLFGGEPTLNMSGIRESVRYTGILAKAQDKEVRLDMTSNGVLFTEDMVQYFVDSQIMVLLSIDGTRAAHDKYRIDKKGLGTFDRVLRGMDLLKKVQPWIGTKMTIMPELADSLFESIRFLYERGVNQFVIGHATGQNWTPESLATYASQLREATHWYRELRKSTDDIVISQFDPSDSSSCGGSFGCRAGRNTIAVEASGEITGCSRISTLEDHTSIGKLGDVNHGLFNLVTRGEMSSCASLKRNCETQGIADNYQGGCFATNYEATGDLFSPNLEEHRIGQFVNLDVG